MEPLVDAQGLTKISEVSPDVLAKGGGHFCPHELYVYVTDISKKDRFTTGLTKNHGFYHTYVRAPPARVGDAVARHIFDQACRAFLTRSPPLRAIAEVNGIAWGDEYISSVEGDTLVARRPPYADDRWAYGCLLRSGQSGWYPPTYAVDARTPAESP